VLRLKIQARPGELQAHGHDLLAVIEKLVKARTKHSHDDDGEEFHLLIPALQQGAEKGHAEVERLREVALEKIDAIIGE
jgi:hypothetical protein